MNFSFRALLKYTIGTLVTLVVLLVVASSLALKLVDKTRVVPAAAGMVKEQTGRELTVHGDIAASFGLYPTIKVSEAALSNASGSNSPQMVEIKSLEIGLALLPLLHKRVSITHVTLEGVNVTLETIGGKANWDMDTSHAEKTEKKTPASSSSFAFSVDNIKAKDITITLRNAGHSDVIQLKQLSLLPGGLFSSGATFNLAGTYNSMPIDLKGKAVFTDDPLTDKMGIEISTLLANDAHIFISGMVVDWANKGQLDLNFTASGKNLALLAPLGAALPATEKYKFESRVKGKKSDLRFSDINLMLDGHTATGDLRYTDNGGKPHLTGSLKSAELVLKSAGGDKKPSGKKTGAESTQEAPLPFSALRSLDADIDITFDKLTLDNVTLEKFRSHAQLQNGQLHIDPLSAHLWEGAANGEINANSNAAVSTSLAIANVSAEKMLRELDVTHNFSGGDFKADLHLSGQGATQHTLLSSLGGTANLFIGKGSYKPDSALAQVADFIRLLSGGKRGSISLNCVVGQFDIAQGVARAHTLVIDTDDAKVTGTGSINLANNTISLVLSPESKSVGLASLALPIRVEGALNNPRWYPDPTATIKKVGNIALDITGTGSDILSGVLGGGKSAPTKTVSASPCTGGTKPAASPAQQTQPAQTTQPATTNSTTTKQPSVKQGVQQDIKNLKHMLHF